MAQPWLNPPASSPRRTRTIDSTRCAAGRGARRRCRRSVDRHAVRSADRQRRSPRCRRRTPSVATHRASARRAASAIRRWLDRRFDLDVPLAQIAACIGTKEFVATLPQYLHLRTPSRTPCCTRPSAYPTYEMGATLAGCRPCRSRVAPTVAPRLRRHRRGRRRTGADAVGQQPVQPDRRARRSRRRRGVGSCPRRAGVQRRVLRRVHLGRPAEHDPAARPRRRRRRALAVEAVEPGRRCGSASTPATPTSSTTSRRCASTSA